MTISVAIFAQTTAGPSDAGTGTNVTGVGTTAWTNPGNITTPGSPYATITVASGATSNYLQGTGSLGNGCTLYRVYAHVHESFRLPCWSAWWSLLCRCWSRRITDCRPGRIFLPGLILKSRFSQVKHFMSNSLLEPIYDVLRNSNLDAIAFVPGANFRRVFNRFYFAF